MRCVAAPQRNASGVNELSLSKFSMKRVGLMCAGLRTEHV